MPKPEIINLYKHAIPKKYLQPVTHYDNEKEIGITIPSRLLCIGSSGAGKTNYIACLIRLIGVFKKIWLFCLNTEEPIYAWMIDHFANETKRINKQLRKENKPEIDDILKHSNKLSDIPKVTSIPLSDSPTLMIFDDLINDKSLERSNIMDIWTLGRKQGITSIFCSQSFFKIPMILRQNSNYIVIKKISQKSDFLRIIREYNLELDKEEFVHLYKECIKKMTDNLTIDVNENNINKKFRHNFQPIILDEQEENL
jgi:hypothetical protein